MRVLAACSKSKNSPVNCQVLELLLLDNDGDDLYYTIVSIIIIIISHVTIVDIWSINEYEPKWSVATFWLECLSHCTIHLGLIAQLAIGAV